MIHVVTDSASMLPEEWRAAGNVSVAPMAVVIDGEAHREGVDLPTEYFYACLDEGRDISTAAPAPGDFLAIYEDARSSGATSVVSIHTGATYSGVLNAARVAANQTEVPVELVDTGTVSFPVALCVAAACTAGAGTDDHAHVAAVARKTAQEVDSVFVVGVPELARRSGRIDEDISLEASTTILRLGPAGLADLGTAPDIDEALDRMAQLVRSQAAAEPMIVGVGDADRTDLGDRLAGLVADAPGIRDITRYAVGPSVAAHSGAGTVGAVWAPEPRRSRR